jgi:hypothetical protein
MASLRKPLGDVLDISVKEATAVRVGDDVDYLGQVDHHQPPVVDEQVVGGQVAVRVAGASERRHGVDKLPPEASQLGRVGAGLGESRSAGSVCVPDKLKQDFRPQDLHGVGNGHMGVV